MTRSGPRRSVVARRVRLAPRPIPEPRL